MDPSEKIVEPNKVFVQNLTWDTTEEELVAAFCPVADVTSVEIRQVNCMLFHDLINLLMTHFFVALSSCRLVRVAAWDVVWWSSTLPRAHLMPSHL